MAILDNHCEEADGPVGFHQTYAAACRATCVKWGVRVGRAGLFKLRHLPHLLLGLRLASDNLAIHFYHHRFGGR